MPFSVLLLGGILVSLALSAALLVTAFSKRSDSSSQRVGFILMSIVGTIILNSWWIGLLTIVFIKFQVLQQDT